MIGHELILQFLMTAQAENQLAQVYCFAGPDQVGKRTLAKELGAKLLKIDQNKLDNHPDYTYIERLVDTKSGKLKKEVSVAQARELRGKLDRRSWLGGYHIVIINEAELLNEESSNALLKTLEEPAHKTLIFLITNNDAALLPTIRSRSQVIYFSLVPDSVLVSGLLAKGFAFELIETVVPLALGRPGLALHLLEDETFRAHYYEELNRFRLLLGQPFYAKVAAIEVLFKDKEEGGERQRERLFVMLDLWLVAWRILLLNKLDLAKPQGAFSQAMLGVDFSIEVIVANLQKVIEAKAQLRYNVNQRLLIEQCLLTF